MASTLLACALIPFPPYVGPEGILSFTTNCGERKAGKRGLNMGLGNFYRRRIKGQTMCLRPGSPAIATWHISIHILRWSFPPMFSLYASLGVASGMATLINPGSHYSQPGKFESWSLPRTTGLGSWILKAPNSLDFTFYRSNFALRVWTWQRFHPLQRAIWCLRFKTIWITNPSCVQTWAPSPQVYIRTHSRRLKGGQGYVQTLSAFWGRHTRMVMIAKTICQGMIDRHMPNKM